MALKSVSLRPKAVDPTVDTYAIMRVRANIHLGGGGGRPSFARMDSVGGGGSRPSSRNVPGSIFFGIHVQRERGLSRDPPSFILTFCFPPHNV